MARFSDRLNVMIHSYQHLTHLATESEHPMRLLHCVSEVRLCD